MDQEHVDLGVQKPVQFKGSCACSRISYECTGLASGRHPTACHCVTCRKLSGGPYHAFADVRPQDVTFFDKQEKLQYGGLPPDTVGGIVFLRFSTVGERAFCSSCYTPLAMRYKHEVEMIALALGAIDEESLTADAKHAFRLAAHIFTSQKAWWVDIERDGLLKHDRFGSDFEAKMGDKLRVPGSGLLLPE